jgi:hypothetical protein
MGWVWVQKLDPFGPIAEVYPLVYFVSHLVTYVPYKVFYWV